MDSRSLTLGFVLFPKLTQLDLTGPFELFSRVPGATVILAAKSLDPVLSENKLKLTPDVTFETAPQFDVLCVPGGSGVNEAMEDSALLEFIRRQSAKANYVTSVCTGGLVLGAAGLLRGYRATTHWLSLELLKEFGATPVSERVVIDRNRITAGGITAGIDFGLTIVAHLCGEPIAREIQLMMEYDPAPPFQSGSPKSADSATVSSVVNARKAFQESRRQIVMRAAARLGSR